MPSTAEINYSPFNLGSKLRLYWSLTKSLQTGLLLMTGIAGYFSVHAAVRWSIFCQLLPSLFLAISGSTVLNMWWDRDIDSKMRRTHMRPAPSGALIPQKVLMVGMFLSFFGIGWSLWLNQRFGIVVFTGLFFDFIVYTMWLKRQTCWAIVLGGVAGALPILSGQVLAMGSVDAIANCLLPRSFSGFRHTHLLLA